MPESDPAAEPASHESGPVATAVYLLGLVGFVVSALAYPVVLVLGTDVRLPLAANAGSVGLLVAWAAHDTFHDPDSAVTSVPGAMGTAMLLLAVYGVLAAVVVAVTSPLHGRFDLVWLLGGAAVVAGVLGFVTFPLEVFTEDATGEPVEGDAPEADGDPATSDGDPATSDGDPATTDGQSAPAPVESGETE